MFRSDEVLLIKRREEILHVVARSCVTGKGTAVVVLGQVQNPDFWQKVTT